MRKILVAVDQGGSKTEVVLLLDSGELLIRLDDNKLRSKYLGDFESKRWLLLSGIIRAALLRIDATIEDVECVMAGVCGADWPDDYGVMQMLLSQELGIRYEKVIIVNDCVAALRSVQTMEWSDQNYGVLYAGTMFNCALESELGKTFVYGRFVNMQDQGSCAIGYKAWQAIIDSFNGFQDPTLMEKLALSYYKTNSLSKLYADFTNERQQFSPMAFASVLFQAVASGDKIAHDILFGFAHRWVKYVINGAPKVGLKRKDRMNLVLTGGVFKSCAQQWLKAIECEVGKYDYNIICSLSKIEPVIGDVLLLLERYYQRPLNSKIIDKVTSSPVYKTLLIQNIYNNNKAESEKP